MAKRILKIVSGELRIKAALRTHTPKHIRGDWSYYTDTSWLGANNMVTV
jgi:hypothetical protein